jgi:hypothetical protein
MKSSALKLGRFLALSQRSKVNSISIGKPMLRSFIPSYMYRAVSRHVRKRN